MVSPMRLLKKKKIKGTLKTYLELLSRKSMITASEENLERYKKRHSSILDDHGERKVEKQIENSRDSKTEVSDLTDDFSDSDDEKSEHDTEIKELHTPITSMISPTVPLKTAKTATGPLTGYAYTSAPPEVGVFLTPKKEKRKEKSEQETINRNEENEHYLIEMNESSRSSHNNQNMDEMRDKYRVCSVDKERRSCQEDLTLCLIM